MEDLQKLLEKGAETQRINDAMPTKAEMVAAFGEGCVEEIKDEAGNVTEVRYYYIREWMSAEQKERNWNLFNEMVAKARGLQCERSDRRDQEKQDTGVVAQGPGGQIIHLSGAHQENHIARKPGWRPVFRRKPQRWVERNGVIVRDS